MKGLKKFQMTILLAVTVAVTAILALVPMHALAYSPNTESTSRYLMIDAQSGEETIIDLSNDTYNNSTADFFLEAAFSGNMADLPDSAGAGTYNIIGADNRTRVNNASLFPYRAIARLDITKQDGAKTYGSGALIGDRIFATAGHNIVKNGQLIKSLTLEFGRNGSNVYYTTSDIKSYILREDYTENNYIEERDYAFVVLNKGISNITGCFDIQTSISVGDTIYTAGYPQDKGGMDMYQVSGAVLKVGNDKVYYNADTEGGQSGSPVYVMKNGKPYIVAIHTNGTHTPDAADASNSGRRIEPNLYNWLKSNGYLD